MLFINLRERFVQGRTLLQQMPDKSLPHPFTEEEISAALQKTKPCSDSPRLRQHPCGIPEEPVPQSSHLAVQIFLQNHGYTFHPEDLEKGHRFCSTCTPTTCQLHVAENSFTLMTYVSPFKAKTSVNWNAVSRHIWRGCHTLSTVAT